MPAYNVLDRRAMEKLFTLNHVHQIFFVESRANQKRFIEMYSMKIIMMEM